MSSWTVTGDEVAWNVTVPPKTTAVLPFDSAKDYSITLDGQSLAKSQKIRTTADSYVLPAGSYFSQDGESRQTKGPGSLRSWEKVSSQGSQM
jgi:hypothetical protein